MHLKSCVAVAHSSSSARTGLLSLTFLLLILLTATAAGASEQPAETSSPPADASAPPTAASPSVDDSHFLGDYGRWIEFAQNTLLAMDLWGSSVTLPQGFGVVLFGWGTQRAAGRFNQDRELGDIIDPLKIDDPFKINRGNFFSFDFAPRGSLQGYFAGIMYGVTDNLTVGVNTMWAVVHIKLGAEFTPGTCERLGVATREEFFRLLEKLGRPAPKLRYDSKPANMGDSDLFAQWNYFRNSWFAGGLTGHVYLPTARKADPNTNIIFGLGPDLEVGNGAWGLGINKMFDFRPPKPASFITFSIGLEGAYYFQSKRKSPSFPAPDRDAWEYLKAQQVDLSFFPDMSDLDEYYYYQPGPWVAASAGFGVGPFSVAYRHGWGFEGNFETNSPGLQDLIDQIGLVGNGDDGKILVAASIPLTPIYLPALVQLRFNYQTDGRNTLVFRDIYQVGMGIFVPINPPARYRLPPRGTTPPTPPTGSAAGTEGGAQ